MATFEASTHDESRRSIGPYRLEGSLGAGGMGEVYLAFDDRLDRHVALKRVRVDRDRANERVRLQREARALARLNHSSIVQCFDLLSLDDEQWLVMEYVEGPRLSSMVRFERLPFERSVRYGRQIAEGLEAAHSRGVLHRDLKTENVVIDTSTDRAKILDFGLVRDLRATKDSSRLTATDAVLGTVRAMAPEQALGREVGPHADLFSLGVLLYETVSGRSPFLAETATATLGRLLTDSPDPLPDDTPPELSALILRLLHKAPEHRFATAGEVAESLAQIGWRLERDADDGPEDTTYAGDDFELEAPPSARPSRYRQALWAAAALLTVALLVGAVGFGPFGLSTEAPQKTEPRDVVSAAAPAPTETSPPDAPAAADGWRALRRYDRPTEIDRAQTIFQARIEAGLEPSNSYSGLARAYWRNYLEESGDAVWLDRAEAAARYASELASTIEESVVARVSLGLVFVQQGAVDAAREAFEEALALDPSNPDAHRGLAEIHQIAGRSTEAEAAFRRAIELRPDDRELRDLLATSLFRQGRLDEAAAAAQQSIDLAPDAVHGYRNLAGIYIAGGQLDPAAEVLETALEIRPAATLYLNLGTVYFFQGLYSRAAEAYEKALEYPFGVHYHVSWANLGDAYRQIPGRRDEAPEAFRQAIRRLEERLAEDPSGSGRDPREMSRLAQYRAKAGDDREARRLLESLDTDEPRSLLRMAITWEILGDRDRALATLARAFEQGLDPAETQRDPELSSLRSDRRFHELEGLASP